MVKKGIISTRDVNENKQVVEPSAEEIIPQKDIAEEIAVPAENDIPEWYLPTYHGKRFVAVIPTWDCGRWIEDTFHSLMEQTLDDREWGVLVIDDGSQDGITAEICTRWKVDHARIRESKGKLHALRIAAGMLPGDTVMVEIDADDGVEPEAMEVMSQAWSETPDMVMIYSQYTCHNENWGFRSLGHSRQAGLTIEDAGWISHLRTYRARDYLAARVDESIRKSTDKETIYRLQEIAADSGRTFRFVDHRLYRYRRRADGAITRMRELDATRARRNAVKRRMGKQGVDLLTVYSASKGNDDGGPGIFWNRLMDGLNAREDTCVVEDIQDADVVIGNIKIHGRIDHQRPWVIRLDGVYFNSRENYAERNRSIAEHIVQAEGVIYQGEWGKAMADEYCGPTPGETTIVPNGVDPPDGWRKKGRRYQKKIVACSRWGDAAYARKFKRLEDTVLSFAKSGLSKKGYELIILGQHYLTDESELQNEYDGVRFVGRVPSIEVWDYLAEAAAFMHLSWIDCCPNGVIEALAAKVPVIYCADGVHEIVGSGGARIIDSPLNHPCDINRPPQLNPDVVAKALREVVALRLPDAEFPDVSMGTCVARYREFLGMVTEKGLIQRGEREERKGPWKRVISSTDDIR